jgi:hypothetical protein
MSDNLQDERWIEICPHYGGPNCNERCAARLREVFKHYDFNRPEVDQFCPLKGEIEAPEPVPPQDRFEVMHQEASED